MQYGDWTGPRVGVNAFYEYSVYQFRDQSQVANNANGLARQSPKHAAAHRNPITNAFPGV